MKKLIVLIMTSVLATGAVANADDVNVVEDPGNIIRVKPMLEGRNQDAATADQASLLQPGLSFGRDKYTFFGEVVWQPENNVKLAKVGVCLFDTRVADDSTKVDNLCGYGSAGTDLATTEADVGSDNPESALQASFEVDSAGTMQEPIIDNSNGQGTSYGHYTNFGIGSAGTLETDFKGDGSTEAVHFGVTVYLSHALAAGTDDYKVRVVAIYEDNSLFELTDTVTYSVANYLSMQTQREAYDFGDIFQSGNSGYKSGINAGSYYANAPVKFSIAATEFKIDPSDDGIPFQGQSLSEVADDKIELFCIDPEGDKGYRGDSAWLSTVPFFMYGFGITPIPASNTEADPESLRLLSDGMQCKVEVGSQIPFGQYSNTVTMGIAAHP